MELKEIYKIADSKQFYTKKELLQSVLKTSSKVPTKKFKDQLRKEKPRNRITILFPIYNEESFLNYSLGSFFNSYIYPQTAYQVIFFLNACTDSSEEITRTLFRRYKLMEEKVFDAGIYKKLKDPGLYKNFFKANDLNSYYILQTKTKGRVNALQVAARMAKKNDSQVVMSFDTDFILDPLCIYNLSQESIKHIVQTKKTVAMTSSVIMVNSREYTAIQKWLRNHLVWKDQKYNSLSGCSLVLNPRWLSENIEKNILEDYTLGVKARSQGYEILKVDGARMWGYRTDYKDDIKQLARSIKGRYQLLAKHPELSEIIYNDHYFTRKFSARFSHVLKSILENPQLILKWLWTFIFVEIAIFKAKRDFQRSQDDIHWTPLSSGR